ncbi:MAG: SDR family oxidoreductase [Clostridia bacterium]|nr:SDR family oxidoreductase [Clostridia bacterium]
MKTLIDLSGRRIIVTGASSGIGKATSILLSRLGAQVIMVARREEKLAEVSCLLEGSNHSYYVADLSNVDQIEGLVKQIANECGKIDGLVYSAGISVNNPINLSKPEKVRDVFMINFFGFYEMVRQVTKKTVYNPGMRIVGISSSASLMGSKAQSIYAASKGAMNSAIRSLAHELSDRQICVNAVAPGMTATEMYENYLQRYGGKEGESNQRLMERQYLGLIGPEDVANAIAFLMSDAARFITGVVLPVDGGMTSC